MENNLGGKRPRAGRPMTTKKNLRVWVNPSVMEKLERFARARGPVSPERLTAEIGKSLNLLFENVETPEDLLPAYMRLIRPVR